MTSLKIGMFALIKFVVGVGTVKIPYIGWFITLCLWAWMVSDIITVANMIADA